MTKFNQKGFSLVQTILAAGFLGGMALVTMQLGKNYQQLKQTTQRSTDLDTYVGVLKRNLIGSKCKEAIDIASKIENLGTAQELDLDSFKDTYKTGEVLFDSSDANQNKHGNVTVSRLYLDLPITASSVNSGSFQRTTDISLAIEYEYNKNHNTAIKKIPIILEFDPSLSGNNITRCDLNYFTDDFQKAAVCESVGGVLNTTTDKCEIEDDPVEILGGYP